MEFRRYRYIILIKLKSKSDTRILVIMHSKETFLTNMLTERIPEKKSKMIVQGVRMTNQKIVKVNYVIIMDAKKTNLVKFLS